MENRNMQKIMDNQFRYMMDFYRVPALIQRGKADVINPIRDGANLAMCSLYNTGWPSGKTNRFLPYEFRCRMLQRGDKVMLYITLPATDAEAPMACSHMAITYHSTMGEYSDIHVFQVERSIRNTTAIGEMQFTPDGAPRAHLNYGQAEKDDEGNIRRIWEIAFDAA